MLLLWASAPPLGSSCLNCGQQAALQFEFFDFGEG